MDELTYHYKPNLNQLDHVSDKVDEDGITTNADDIKTQVANNYSYNSIGQLVSNTEEGINYMYNASGLVTEVQKDNQPLVKFYYNDKGHRVRKESFVNGTLTSTDHYVRDAAGSTLAIYNNSTLTEMPIYGASRLGVYYTPPSGEPEGEYVYQLTDHLGNVRAVITKVSNDVSISSSTDYYPGGMTMPGRQTIGGELYRYGYQGEYAETDPETGKPMFQLRLYDPRINRWLSPDPMGQYFSPYMSMDNRWNMSVDPTGGSTDWHYDKDGNLVTDAGDTAQGLADFKGISLSQAQDIISSEGFVIDFNTGLGTGLVGEQVAFNRLSGSPYKLGNFEFENRGATARATSFFLLPFQHIRRSSGVQAHTASIRFTGNVSVGSDGKHILTVDGYASKSNSPSVSVAQSYINIKYSWDKSSRLATKSKKFGRNPRSFIYSSDETYLGHGTSDCLKTILKYLKLIT